MKVRLAPCLALVCLIAVPARAQEAPPVDNGTPVPEAAVAGATPDEGQAQLPPVIQPLPLPPATPTDGGNVFKLVGSDFKNFFSTDTARTLMYTSFAAIVAAPWDREGVNNGFNIPTTLFESGNMIGQFAFQVGVGMGAYGAGKAFGNGKMAVVGRDIVRAQVVSQVMVQTLKYSIQRPRPDNSNDKSFPSGHSAAAFATASVLNRHYGWKVGAPAFAVSSYVALARMAWNRHHATDVVMGAGFGIAAARTVTMSVGKSKFSVGMQPQVGGASVNFTKIYK